MAKANDFLTLTKKSAQNLAEKDNQIFRLIRIDDQAYLAYPEDTRSDRVCVEIDNGKVSKATIR